MGIFDFGSKEAKQLGKLGSWNQQMGQQNLTPGYANLWDIVNAQGLTPGQQAEGSVYNSQLLNAYQQGAGKTAMGAYNRGIGNSSWARDSQNALMGQYAGQRAAFGAQQAAQSQALKKQALQMILQLASGQLGQAAQNYGSAAQVKQNALSSLFGGMGSIAGLASGIPGMAGAVGGGASDVLGSLGWMADPSGGYVHQGQPIYG